MFVVIGSLTIAGPVIYSLLGGERANGTLDEPKSWLRLRNAVVMTVLFLLFGVNLISKSVPALT